MRDKTKADIAEKKRKEITDFRHTKPCSTCGSTHGCNCDRQLSDGMRGNSISGYGYGY